MQMPMYVGMGRGLLAAGVQQREDFSSEQKAQAMASIDAFAKWAESAEFADPAKARQVIGHVCKAARDLKLESLDQLRALSFDEAVQRGDIVFVAVKNILATVVSLATRMARHDGRWYGKDSIESMKKDLAAPTATPEVEAPAQG